MGEVVGEGERQVPADGEADQAPGLPLARPELRPPPRADALDGREDRPRSRGTPGAEAGAPRLHRRVPQLPVRRGRRRPPGVRRPRVRRLEELLIATSGEAVVLSSQRPEPRNRVDDTAGEVDVSEYGVGRHTRRLEGRLPGLEPYEVEDRFKVPPEVQFGRKRGFLLRPLMKRSPIPVGITLPVDVDPSRPDNVTIDWDSFLAKGGRDEMKRLNESAAVERLHQTYPEQAAQMRENAKCELPALIANVRAGNVSRKDF